jgi:hypothetical protein
VQVVDPNSRVSNAWLPIALIVVALGVMVCAFAASQGNLFSFFGGTATPTPSANSTAALPTPTLAPIVIATGTAEQPTETPTTEAAPTDTPEPLPTDTPPPTIEPPPTVTPEPLPTETSIPAESTPTSEPVEPTPLPSGESFIAIDGPDFAGGYTKPTGYHGRSAEWVYGQGTQYSTMQAGFTINDKPKGSGNLTIVGLDSEDDPKTLMRIVVNGQTIYEGENPLPNDNKDGPNAPGNWGTVSFRLDAKVLQQGENTIAITNLDPSDQINYPIFIMVDYVTISW